MSKKRFLMLVLVVALGAGVALAGVRRIAQKNRAFSAQKVVVRVNEEVEFVNDDSVTHNVFAVGQNFSFNLKRQAPGTTSRVRFEREGTYECRCAIHPNMKLQVEVVR